MKGFIIVFSMLAVMAVLFLLVPFFRRNEISKNKTERKYFALLQDYKSETKNNKEEILNELKSLAMNFYKLNDIGEAKEKVLSDIQVMELSK